ncbi:hypothetical protein GCM10010336_19300 [Streptomyces goshikiensis]|nr:hypothetical protein GCM10010336_19300 [Streptomyces goshikiensis]
MVVLRKPTEKRRWTTGRSGGLVEGSHTTGTPADRDGPPGRVPVVQAKPGGRLPANSGHPGRDDWTVRQAQSTRVSGVKAGPPLVLELSLNSA